MESHSELLSEIESPEDLSDLQQLQTWDVATRYHEFKARIKSSQLRKRIRSLSAQTILERAQNILGSVVHPFQARSAPVDEVPSHAEQVEFDLEETLENSLALGSKTPPTQQDFWMSYHVKRQHPVVLTIDTSLSMTGEKLALTAVALAVVLFEFSDHPIGIVAFENQAKIIKLPDERPSILELIERFLDVPTQGYTHLENGLKAALGIVRGLRTGQHGRFGPPPSTVLVTDGKYTAGKDPAYLAPRFPHLIVLKMGKERASLELCRELAKRGQGALREVGELEALPNVMYGIVKDLLRGHGGEGNPGP